MPRPWLHQQAEKFRKRRLDFLLVDRPGGRIDRRARLRIHGSCLVRKMLQVHRVIVLQSVPLCAAHNGTWRQRFRAVLNAPPGSIALASNHGQVGVSSNQLPGPGVRDGGRAKSQHPGPPARRLARYPSRLKRLPQIGRKPCAPATRFGAATRAGTCTWTATDKADLHPGGGGKDFGFFEAARLS